MKFYVLSGSPRDDRELEMDYRQARKIGPAAVGDEVLFIKAGLRRYYIAYGDIYRCFRRVQMVPAKMCCGKGEFQIENLVIADRDRELIQVQLPGTKAAKELMRILKEKCPDALFTYAGSKEDADRPEALPGDAGTPEAAG